MTIPGLPEGVECVRLGIAGPEDFELTLLTGMKRPRITQGKREGSISQVIVQPAKGWKFQPAFDVREYERYFIATKDLDQPEELTLKFVAKTVYDRELIQQFADGAKNVPGYIKPEEPVADPHE